MGKLTEIRDAIHNLQPDDTKSYMLRAILRHELDTRFAALKESLKAYGTHSIEVMPRRIVFHPYMQKTVLKNFMLEHFEVRNNHLPIRVPPKYWGKHFLNPDPLPTSSNTTP